MVKKKKPAKKTIKKKIKKISLRLSSQKKKTVKKPTKKTLKKKVKKTPLPLTSQKKKNKAKRPLSKMAKRHGTKTTKGKKGNLASRMLQLASNMVAYQMLLSHLLRPISGEPIADGASLDEMSERLRMVRKQLLSELGHHPVMAQKISSAYQQTEQLWKAHQSTSPDDPDYKRIRLEAKEASLKSKEACAAMSDLVAALRYVQ